MHWLVLKAIFICYTTVSSDLEKNRSGFGNNLKDELCIYFSEGFWENG